MKNHVFALGLAAVGVLAACGQTVQQCTTTAQCPAGQVCTMGECRQASNRTCANNTDCPAGETCQASVCRGSGGGGTGGAGGAGAGGMGRVYTGCDISNPANPMLDSDCDGLTDAEEYATDYGGGAKTNPCASDSDGDGLGDGQEMGKSSTIVTCMGFVADTDPRSKSNPTKVDSDNDGLADGVEDANKNGKRDPGETDPLKGDSDCDGYSDQQETMGAAGCNTDPSKRDSDGDGLPDGVEGGLTPPGHDAMGCTYTTASFDADMGSRTNACSADSDGDGIMDGAEDTNLNGRTDMGELNPGNPADAMGPATQACATANLRPVKFEKNGFADVNVALAPSFTEVSTLTQGGQERGLIFYDGTNRVAGFAVVKTVAASATAVAQEQAGRAALGGATNPLVQNFTSWDGYASIRATYDVSGTQDLKAKLNAVAGSVLGSGTTGTLMGAAGVSGPFRAQVQYTVRTAPGATDARLVVVAAFIPAASASQQPVLFTQDDVAGGSAVAQFGDFDGTQCEVFQAQVNQTVDFLWVVDDSCSMEDSQTAVSRAGSLFGGRLTTAGLNWRAAGVSTGWYSSAWDGKFFEFTDQVATLTSWFTGTTAFGITGNGNEQGFSGLLSFLNRSHPSNNPGMFRMGALAHIIFLSDTRDQSGTTASSIATTMNTRFGAGNWSAHGIVCTEGTDCGDGTPEVNPGKYHTLIRNVGGVLGNIEVFNPASPTTQQLAQQEQTIDAILRAVVGSTGHRLQRPPINATIKVAMAAGSTRGTCNTADVPRDRTNGWDIDSTTRRVAFFGNCIPSASGVQVAVSYRYWNDAMTRFDGDPCGMMCVAPLVCDAMTRMCVCPNNCGGCSAGLTCNRATCSCEPQIN